MKRYIITGAVGHLASTIIKILKADKNNEIFGLILPAEHAINESNVTYKTGDITDIVSLDDFFQEFATNDTIVIHTAALIILDDKASSAMQKVNVEGTRNVVEVCKKHKVKRLVYLSSIEALGAIPEGVIGKEKSPFDEDAINGFYGKTKAQAGNIVLKAANEGLETVIVMPSCIFGPGDSGSNPFNVFLKMFLSHKMPVSVKGGVDLVDVRDVANGCILAAEKGKSGECYILSNQFFLMDEVEACTRKEVGGIKKISLPLGFIKAFVPLIVFFSRLAHKKPLVTKYSLKVLEEKAHFSHEKASNELGYKPRSMQQSVHDMNVWIKSSKKKRNIVNKKVKYRKFGAVRCHSTLN